MRGRMKFSLQTGLIILIFSFLLTAVFTFSMLWFSNPSMPVVTDSAGIYLLSPVDYEQIIRDNGTLKLNSENYIGAADYRSAVTEAYFKNLIPVSVIFLIAVFIISVCLWLILKSAYEKRIRKISEQISSAVTDSAVSEHPVLTEAYEKIKQKFDDRLNDYKRLNSYLSHEQKNAVAILRTGLELSENRTYLKNLDDIADSIDDILTLSENSDTSPLAAVDVSLVCAEVYDSYRKLSDNISFYFDGDGDTEILARSRWIYRAVANLLDNAVKYGEGKPITLSVKAEKGSVIVCVKDNGIGISEEKQETIFQNRYRINELNRNGYGIGLSLVSHVCDLCGGFVMADSNPGQGSAFYLSFPQKLF